MTDQPIPARILEPVEKYETGGILVPTDTSKSNLLSQKWYDSLKWLAQYFIPAIATLYFALAAIWGLPYGEQVVGTLTAVDTFLGVILGISNRQYKTSGAYADGTLRIDSTENKELYKLEFNGPLTSIKDREAITFKVAANSQE